MIFRSVLIFLMFPAIFFLKFFLLVVRGFEWLICDHDDAEPGPEHEGHLGGAAVA